MTYDVIVVGGGPVGSAASRACAEKGLSTLCVEEHGTIGYPVQCAGLLSNAAMAECRVSERSVINIVQGARLVSLSGNSALIDAQRKKAVVIDRGKLDREMAASAADAGAEFRLKTSVCGVQESCILTRGINGHERIPFKILIAADGPRSTIARLYGMPRAKIFLSGIQADIIGDCDQRFVELFPDASPDFFGWKIPIGKDRVRIGLCGKDDVKSRFLAFLKKNGGKSSLHLVTGTLPLGCMPRTWQNRTLFIGDAAGFAKPTSGGGIYTGIRSACHAAEVAADACEQDRYDDAFLSAYERLWYADIGRELELGYRLLQFRQHLTSKDIEELVSLLNDPTILDAIIRYGDMDRPGNLITTLIKKPAFLRWVSPHLVQGIKSLFF